MSAPTGIGRLLVGLACVAFLGGCTAGASPTPKPASPTADSTLPKAIVTPSTATPSPTQQATGPITYGPVTVVTGTATCPAADLGSSTTDSDGVQHFRDVDFRCTMRTDDPRVSGAHTSGAWNIDWWGAADLSDGALVQWGTPRLENAGGAWEGTGSGVYSSGRGDIIAFWYTGTGGYTGLSYFELWTGKEPWTIQGQIFPGDAPNPTGTLPVAAGLPAPTTAASTTAPSPTATAVAYGPVTVVTGTEDCPGLDPSWTIDPDDTAHVRDLAVACTDAADDPRVSGSHHATWSMDLWGSLDAGRAAGVQSASVRLENEGGAWEGRLTGVASLPEPGDLMVIWYSGTGGYAGLGYFQVITGVYPDYAIRGQVFPGDPPTP